MKRTTGFRGFGITAIVVLAVWIAMSVGAVTAAHATATALPCVPTPAGPGVQTVCLNPAQRNVTATSFSSHQCDHILGVRNTSLDYFIFVLPASGDPSRFFTGLPTPPTVYFSSGPVTGVIDTNTKFFSAAAPAGATLLDATALSNNGTGTPKGGEAQYFNLTHTCPATTTPPPDRTPPLCVMTGMGTDSTGHKFIQVTIQDAQSGPASIVATTIVNSDNGNPAVPLYFTVEDTLPFVITFTKLDVTKSSQVALTVTDLAGNVTHCDPVFKADPSAVLRAKRAARAARHAARLQ